MRDNCSEACALMGQAKIDRIRKIEQQRRSAEELAKQRQGAVPTIPAAQVKLPEQTKSDAQDKAAEAERLRSLGITPELMEMVQKRTADIQAKALTNAEDVFLSGLKVTIDTAAYSDCKSLLEQATALVDTGKVPIISNPGLSFSYRTKLDQLYRNPAYAAGTCLHEAAHAIL